MFICSLFGSRGQGIVNQAIDYSWSVHACTFPDGIFTTDCE